MLGHVNAGSGAEISIRDLAALVAQTVGYRGGIAFDASKPDGTPRKLMDSSRINALGWRRTIGLEPGPRRTYAASLQTADAHAPTGTHV